MGSAKLGQMASNRIQMLRPKLGRKCEKLIIGLIFALSFLKEPEFLKHGM